MVSLGHPLIRAFCFMPCVSACMCLDMCSHTHTHSHMACCVRVSVWSCTYQQNEVRNKYSKFLFSTHNAA